MTVRSRDGTVRSVPTSNEWYASSRSPPPLLRRFLLCPPLFCGLFLSFRPRLRVRGCVCVGGSVRPLQGPVNPGLPIRASVSEDGRLAVCGSEDGFVHVWDAGPDVSWARECVCSLVSFDRIFTWSGEYNTPAVSISLLVLWIGFDVVR